MQVISLETAILKLSKQIKMLKHYCSLSQEKPRWQGVLFMALQLSIMKIFTVLQSFLYGNFPAVPKPETSLIRNTTALMESTLSNLIMTFTV